MDCSDDESRQHVSDITSKSRGYFILFEGLDKMGKSTQIQLLHEKLNSMNISNAVYAFPNRTTPIGQLLDKYLKKEIELDTRSAHMMFVANRWEFYDEMKRKLDDGITLLVDRYSDSGIVYSCANNESLTFSETMTSEDTDFISRVIHRENGLLWPDLAFFFVPGWGDVFDDCDDLFAERFEVSKFQERVYYAYKYISFNSAQQIEWRLSKFKSDLNRFKIYPQLGESNSNMPSPYDFTECGYQFLVPSDNTIENIHKKIGSLVLMYLKQHEIYQHKISEEVIEDLIKNSVL